MASTKSVRNAWAWAAILTQGVIFAACLWGFVQMLLSWRMYSRYTVQVLPYFLESLALTLALGIALWGLWRTESWGWVLAALANGAMCLLTLNNLLRFPAMIRIPKWQVLSLLDLLAFALVLHRPVRRFFFGSAAVVLQKGGRQRVIQPAERFLRALLYFAVAVVVTCLVTSFALVLLLGQKGGGTKGLLFLSALGIEIGGVPSFLFALLLTLAARRIGLNRLWAWLLTGAILAPGLTAGMGALLLKMETSAPGPGSALLALLTGPMYLHDAPWLTIPAGLVAAFVCFQMCPWSFGESE